MSRSVKESGLPEMLRLKALFETFEEPWDEERSREVFAKVMAKIEERERRRKWMAMLARTAGVAGATAAAISTYEWLLH